MSKAIKSIAQWFVSLFVGAYLLTWTLAWVSGQPRISYGTMLVADICATGIVLGVVFLAAIIFKIFED